MSQIIPLHKDFIEEKEPQEPHGWTGTDWPVRLLLPTHREWCGEKIAFEPKQVAAALIGLALSKYASGLISLGRAAEIARLPYEDMIDTLRARGIAIRFGPESIEEAESERKDLLEQFKQSRRRR
jgi:predicted HTH domain antitoxin